MGPNATLGPMVPTATGMGARMTRTVASAQTQAVGIVHPSHATTRLAEKTFHRISVVLLNTVVAKHVLLTTIVGGLTLARSLLHPTRDGGTPASIKGIALTTVLIRMHAGGRCHLSLKLSTKSATTSHCGPL